MAQASTPIQKGRFPLATPLKMDSQQDNQVIISEVTQESGLHCI